MNIKDKFALWIVGAILFCLFIYMVSSILLPFIVAVITAYFLDPVTKKIEKLGLSRTAATFTITILFFAIFIILSIILVPLFYDQFTSMIQKIPTYVHLYNEEILPYFSTILEKFDPESIDSARQSVREASSYILNFAGKVIIDIWSSGIAIVNLLSLLFVTPIVTFYILRDWHHIIDKLSNLIPPKHSKIVGQLVGQIDVTLSAYIRGQTNVCLILGIFYAAALTLAGLEFGFVIGLSTGILSLIPYVGLLFGFVVAMVIAVFQFSNSLDIGIIALIFITGQIIEGNFITPKLVGDKVGLHPVWIIFCMLAGATMFGFIGLLLAIPTTAIIGVLTRFLIYQYLNSSFYLEQKNMVQKN